MSDFALIGASRLADLEDVKLAPAPQDGEVLGFAAATNSWHPQALPPIPPPPAVEDLTNVLVTPGVLPQDENWALTCVGSFNDYHWEPRAFLRIGQNPIYADIKGSLDGGGNGAVTGIAQLNVNNQDASACVVSGTAARLVAGQNGVPQARLDLQAAQGGASLSLRVGSTAITIQGGSVVFSQAATPSVTGSRGGNAALASLLSQLDTMGLIQNDSEA